MDVSELHQIRESADREILRLWICTIGYLLTQSKAILPISIISLTATRPNLEPQNSWTSFMYFGNVIVEFWGSKFRNVWSGTFLFDLGAGIDLQQICSMVHVKALEDMYLALLSVFFVINCNGLCFMKNTAVLNGFRTSVIGECRKASNCSCLANKIMSGTWSISRLDF